MKLPSPVVAVLSAPVEVGRSAQAFPFLTVADDGAPHCSLLSSTELAVAADGAVVHAVLAGRRSRRHLLARPRATLLVTEGTTVHSCGLTLSSSLEHDGVFAAALDVVRHEADSLGIPLQPLSFVPPSDLAGRERWDVTAAALAVLAALAARRSEEPRRS